MCRGGGADGIGPELPPETGPSRHRDRRGGAASADALCRTTVTPHGREARPRRSNVVVPAEGIEPPTFGLQNRCTTAVLHRQAL